MSLSLREAAAILPQLFKGNIYSVKEQRIDAQKFLGENKKQVLILTCNEQHDFLSEQEEVLLLKGGAKKSMLEALGLKPEDIALVNCKSGLNCSFKIFSHQFRPEKLISFGVVPAQIGLHMEVELYRVISLNNCRLLFSESLEAIAIDNKKKAKLWEALQSLFGMK